MSKGNTFETDLLKLILQNVDAALIGDATGNDPDRPGSPGRPTHRGEWANHSLAWKPITRGDRGPPVSLAIPRRNLPDEPARSCPFHPEGADPFPHDVIRLGQPADE